MTAAEIESAATFRAVRECGQALRTFARIGRWGTCGFCPHDAHGEVYPEFCDCTDGYDHNLTGRQAIEQYERSRERHREAVLSEMRADRTGATP